MDNLLRYTTALLFCCSLGLSVRAEEPVMKDEPKGPIVFTVKAISARTKLAKDMFREEWVPRAQIPQAAVSRIFELEGRIAQYDLPKGCVVSTPFASGLYTPKGDVDYRDPIPCIYDTSTNSWSIKESVKVIGKKPKPDRDSVRKYIKGMKDSNNYEATDCSTKPKVTKLGPGQLKGI